VNRLAVVEGGYKLREMRHRSRLFLCVVALALSAAIGTATASATPAGGGVAASGGVARCAGALSTKITSTGSTTSAIEAGSTPAPDSPCWEEVPYPFVSEGREGNVVSHPSNLDCPETEKKGEPCDLTVTSLAFRSWNRGLAATRELGAARERTDIWTYNGEGWRRDPTFASQRENCLGQKILWAGKLDYWLVGGSSSLGSNGRVKWSNPCRFDGQTLEWGPVPVPSAALEHASQTNSEGKQELRRGGITSGACFAWNNCWFFGSYATVLHWSEEPCPGQTKATLELCYVPLSSLQGRALGEVTAAAARTGPGGETAGFAVASTTEGGEAGPLQRQPGGEAPIQILTSLGAVFSPLSVTLPTTPQEQDPFRTDLVAVDTDAAGQAWVAGNPAELRPELRQSEPPLAPPRRAFASDAPQPAPLLSVAGGALSGECSDPPAATLFTYTPVVAATQEAAPGRAAGAFLWSSISVITTQNEALAGGEMRRPPAEVGPAPGEDAVGEPVIAQVGCGGVATLTRFRAGGQHSPPVDRAGAVTAIAASARNDAWAAMSYGQFAPGREQEEAPHLYRLTNGQPPEAPAGDDVESRPEPKEEAPVYVFEESPPPPPPPPPAVVNTTHSLKLPPAIYDIKVKLHTRKRAGQVSLALYITFRVRRAVTLGAEALRHGHVVSRAHPRHFTSHKGTLILNLTRKHWPTKIKFVG
jgi:hypothetical protein